MIDPKSPDYIHRSNYYIKEILERTGGATFILFTSYGHLYKCKEFLQQHKK